METEPNTTISPVIIGAILQTEANEETNSTLATAMSRSPEAVPNAQPMPPISSWKKQFNRIFAGSVSIFLIGMFGYLQANHFDLRKIFTSWQSDSTSIASDNSLPNTANVPYEIISITMLVNIRDDMTGGGNLRKASVRFVYVLRLLRDVHESETAFVEHVWTIRAKKTIVWAGTAKQTNQGEPGFSVELAGKKGEIHTVETGALLEYDLSTFKTEDAPGQTGSISAKEEYFAYDNSAGDIIHRIKIIIDGNVKGLKAVKRGAVRVTNNQSKYADVNFQEMDGVPNSTVISAHWTDIDKGEIVYLKFRWE